MYSVCEKYNKDINDKKMIEKVCQVNFKLIVKIIIYIFNLMMISRVMRLNRVIKYNNSMTKPKLTDYEYINKIQ